MRWVWAVASAAALVSVSNPALSEQRNRPRPAQTTPSPLVGALEGCRKITNPTQRLACYDNASGALVQAARTGQVRIVDRAQIQQAKRSLFGFSMPRLSIFSGDPNDDTTDKLETTIASVTRLNSGKYRMVIAEGNAVWETTEDRLTLDAPRKGQKIVILRGALGNYFLQINGQVGIRGRRVG